MFPALLGPLCIPLSSAKPISMGEPRAPGRTSLDNLRDRSPKNAGGLRCSENHGSLPSWPNGADAQLNIQWTTCRRHTAATSLIAVGVDGFGGGDNRGLSVETLLGLYNPHHPCVSAEGGEDDRPSRVGNISAGDDGAPLYFNRNSVLTAAPLLNAEGPGSSSPGWRTPPCGSCVPHSTGTWGLRAPPQRLAHW